MSSEKEIFTTAKSGTVKEGVIKTLGSELPPEHLFTESIDNIVDFTPDGETAHIHINMYLHDNYIKISNHPSTGATREELERLNLLGRESHHKRGGDSYSGHHGVGFMTAAFSLLDPESGGLYAHTFFTDENGNQQYVEYNRPQWHTNIDQDVDIVHSDQATPKEPTTTFVLENLNPHIAQNMHPRKIADYLGLVYGELIKQGKLNINILAQEHNNSTARSIHVIPVEIPFAQKTTTTEWFSAAPNEEGPFIRITHAELSKEVKDGHDSDRNKRYTRTHRHEATTLYAQDVLIYSGGKLDKPTTLTKLEIPYAKSGVSPIIVAVEVAPDPRLAKTAFKTSYDPKDPTTQAINQALHDYFAPIVEQYHQRARSKDTLDANKLRLLNDTYDQISKQFVKRFNAQDLQDLFHIDPTFLSSVQNPNMSVEITTTEVPTREAPKKSRKKQHGEKKLPGGKRRTQARESDVPKNLDTDDKFYEISVDNPFPTILTGSFEPTTRAMYDPYYQLETHEMPAVILNNNEAILSSILSSKTHRRQDRQYIARVVLETLLDYSGKFDQKSQESVIQDFLNKIK